MAVNLKIKIDGVDRNDLILVGDLTNGGPICTKQQIENAELGFGHLHDNGTIYSEGKLIGTVADIDVIGIDHTEVVAVSFKGMKGRNPFIDLMIAIVDGSRGE